MIFFLKYFKAFAIIISVFLAKNTYAEKWESNIQEAIYLFEMKGDVDNAIKKLEEVSVKGDKVSKEKAFFYLGKIQDILDKKNSAKFYYNQSLERTQSVSSAYFLADRIAATEDLPEKFLQTPLHLKSPIYKFFGNNPSYLLLQNNSIQKLDDDKLTAVDIQLPENIQIFNIDDTGVWFQENDSLVFESFLPNHKEKKYHIPNITHFVIHQNKVLVQGSSELIVINNFNLKARIEKRYQGYIPEGYFSYTNEFVLNGTDNNLHFISAENGTENHLIEHSDIIKKVFIDNEFIYVEVGNFLYGYTPTYKMVELWRHPVSNIEGLVSLEKNIVFLEASGKLTLMNKLGAYFKSEYSDATSIYTLARGTIGLFNNEGGITVVDTALFPIWNFNFLKPIVRAPLFSTKNIYYDFGENRLQSSSKFYYGKKTITSKILEKEVMNVAKESEWKNLPKDISPKLDSLLKLEPGNTAGLFLKALYLENHNGTVKEKQKAWSEALRLSSRRTNNYILNYYGKYIGAKFVTQLPISPKTPYPQIFSAKNYLFTIDPSANILHRINSETGNLEWSAKILYLENSPAIYYDQKILSIASGAKLLLYDLENDSIITEIKLQSQAYDVKINDASVYVGMRNGMLSKYAKKDGSILWSRNLYTGPFLMAVDDSIVYTCDLDYGKFTAVDKYSSVIKQDFNHLNFGAISQMASSDSLVAVVSSNKINLLKKRNNSLLEIFMEKPIASLQFFENNEKLYILVGLSDQTILLYSSQGTPLWKFKGKNSIFIKPFVYGNFAYIDQGNEVVALSLRTGKIEKRFSIPGGAGSPFVAKQTLFSISPKGILHGFSL